MSPDLARAYTALLKLLAEVNRRPVDWSPPKGDRIGGVPPWQGGYLLERAS